MYYYKSMNHSILDAYKHCFQKKQSYMSVKIVNLHNQQVYSLSQHDINIIDFV